MSAWKRLAEAFGIEDEGPNWDAVNKRKNMQRYGAQDRRTQLGPTAYFNNKGTGSAQRQGTAAAMQPDMTPRPGGLQIPFGQDRPGQQNPLMTPTPAKRAGLSTAPNSPEGGEEGDDEDWVSMLSGNSRRR